MEQELPIIKLIEISLAYDEDEEPEHEGYFHSIEEAIFHLKKLKQEQDRRYINEI